MDNKTRILVLYENLDYSSHIEYTFNIILSTLGLNYKISPHNRQEKEILENHFDLIISYGKTLPGIDNNKRIHIYESNLLWGHYLSTDSLPQYPLVIYKNIPITYTGNDEKHPLLNKSERMISTNIDIVASSFFMLSRYEEVLIRNRGEHDRFPASDSIAYKANFLNIPVVNEYITFLQDWIVELGVEITTKSLWKNNCSFAACLTHDIDHIKKFSLAKPPVRAIGSLLLKHLDIKEAIDRIFEYTGTMLKLRNDPYDTFDYMLNMEQNFGFKSSFYFMSEEYYKDDYIPDFPVFFRKLLSNIINRGCEIGLHGSYESPLDKSRLIIEKENLQKFVNTKITGIRQHYLRFKVPETWKLQSETGFNYDTTIAYAEKCGFRCGFCLPYKPFDVLNNNIFDIWELPLTVMEGSLQNTKYENLEPDAAFKQIKNLIDITEKYNGCFVFLWHNTSFDSSSGWGIWRNVYEKTMNYLYSKDCWVTTGKEVIEWWQSNTYFM